MLTGLQVCKKKKRPDRVLRHQSLSCETDPHSVKKRKRRGLPDESLKSESEPCRAPPMYVCVRQCVFHNRLPLKLRWVHEFQAVGLLFFSTWEANKGPAHSECWQHSVLAQKCILEPFRFLSVFIEFNPRWLLSTHVAAADVLPLCTFQVGDAGGRRAGRRTEIYGGGTSESLFCQQLQPETATLSWKWWDTRKRHPRGNITMQIKVLPNNKLGIFFFFLLLYCKCLLLIVTCNSPGSSLRGRVGEL